MLTVHDLQARKQQLRKKSRVSVRPPRLEVCGSLLRWYKLAAMLLVCAALRGGATSAVMERLTEWKKPVLTSTQFETVQDSNSKPLNRKWAWILLRCPAEHRRVFLCESEPGKGTTWN